MVGGEDGGRRLEIITSSNLSASAKSRNKIEAMSIISGEQFHVRKKVKSYCLPKYFEISNLNYNSDLLMFIEKCFVSPVRSQHFKYYPFAKAFHAKL